MTYTSLEEPIELYQSKELSLDQAAARGGVSVTELVSALREKGVELRPEDEGAVTTTRY